MSPLIMDMINSAGFLVIPGFLLLFMLHGLNRKAEARSSVSGCREHRKLNRCNKLTAPEPVEIKV